MRSRASQKTSSRRRPAVARQPWALWSAVAITLLVASLEPSQAQAQQVRRKFKDPIHVIQPKPVVQEGRLDVQPRVGYVFNDPLASTLKAGVQARYHLSERIKLGAMFDWYNFGPTISGASDTYDQVQRQTNTAPDSPVLNWFAGLELGWTPIFGKFALFNSGIVYYDITLSVGGGFANAASLQLTSAKGGPALTLALINHIFVNDWVSVNIGVRDVSYFASLQNAEGDSTLSHAVSLDLGVSLFLGSSDRGEDASPSED